jgi:tetratricopeptide (TPR) repeat protein
MPDAEQPTSPPIEAVAELPKAPEFSSSAETNHHNGELAREEGRFNDAFANYYVAMGQYESVGQQLPIAEAHLGIGLTHQRMATNALAEGDKVKSAQMFSLAKSNIDLGLTIATKHDDQKSATLPRAMFRAADAMVRINPKTEVAFKMYENAIAERNKRFPTDVAETGQYRYQYGDALCGADKFDEGIMQMKQGQDAIDKYPPADVYTGLVWNSGACMRLAVRLAQQEMKKPQAERSEEWKTYLEKARTMVTQIGQQFPDKKLRDIDLKAAEDQIAAFLA